MRRSFQSNYIFGLHRGADQKSIPLSWLNIAVYAPHAFKAQAIVPTSLMLDFRLYSEFKHLMIHNYVSLRHMV